MKVAILAGGKGTRLSELTREVPKPMVKIGSKPILIHIINLYTKYNLKDFFILVGHKSKVIKNYFKNFKKVNQSFEYKINKTKCKITLLETGKDSMTGGRLKKLENILENDEEFMFTYGDGISNVNLKKLENFHFKHGKLVTVTAVHPIPRFGEIDIHKNRVTRFSEKKRSTKIWINGGFFILNKKFLRYIKNDSTILEREPLEKAAKKKQMFAFKHRGFWQCMDTKRDKDLLSNLLKKIKPW